MTLKFTPARLSLVVASVFALNGCIEVEDDSNDELTAALLQQNEILAEQVQAAQQTNTVTVQGVIYDAKDSTVVDNALITVKTISTTYAQDQDVAGGTFTVSGLPANSALEIVISSPDDSFMSRTFYMDTGVSTSGVSEKDLGKFFVSESQEYNIDIQNSETNMPITGLSFSASTYVGNGSSADQFEHMSTFDDVSGLYKITLPKFLNYTVFASIDADKDGVRDIEPESFSYVSGTNIVISSSRIDELATLRFYTPESAILDDLALRLSIVDEAGEPISGATVSVDDEQNGLSASFDVDSQQYLLDVVFDGDLTVEIPSFTVGDVTYSSSSVTLREHSQGRYYVSNSGSVANSNYDVVKSDIIELVIRPQVLTEPTTNLEVVLVSKPEVSSDNSLSVFYSQPVELPGTSTVTLLNRDAILVVRGSDSATDLVLPGTTTITNGEFVNTTTNFSLNNTKLKVTPANALQSDTRYTYSVGSVTILSSSLNANPSQENSVNFTTPIVVSDSPFSIDDLVLDNNNYTKAGAVIVPQNTAGVDNSFSEYRNYADLYLPEEANQLKTLVLSMTGYTRDGVSVTDNNTYTLIENGEVQISSVGLVSLARNESVQYTGSSGSVKQGTTLADTNKRYYTRYYVFLADDTDSATNNITFNYAYETKAGEVESGAITLPVQ